jgi:hypothetical protein
VCIVIVAVHRLQQLLQLLLAQYSCIALNRLPPSSGSSTASGVALLIKLSDLWQKHTIHIGKHLAKEFSTASTLPQADMHTMPCSHCYAVLHSNINIDRYHSSHIVRFHSAITDLQAQLSACNLEIKSAEYVE